MAAKCWMVGCKLLRIRTLRCSLRISSHLFSDGVRWCYFWRGWWYGGTPIGLKVSYKNEWYHSTTFLFSFGVEHFVWNSVNIYCSKDWHTCYPWAFWMTDLHSIYLLRSFDITISLGLKSCWGWTLCSSFFNQFEIACSYSFFWLNCVGTYVPPTWKFQGDKTSCHDDTRSCLSDKYLASGRDRSMRNG